MMAAHPLTGVGPGGFVRAFPNYSEKRPHQAHNTYVQFGAEFGPIALIAFAVLLGSCITSLWRIEPIGLSSSTELADPDLFAREATLATIVGLTVCAFFLSLQLFEVIYFLVFMSIALIANHHERLASNKVPDSPTWVNRGGLDTHDTHMLIPARRKQSDRPLDD
jgi:O-antigen ligase